MDVRLPKEFTETYNTPAPTRPATPRENNGADGTNGKAMKKEDGEWVKFEDLDAEDLLKGGKGMCLLPNDWPYNVPYGVRHSILWTRVSYLDRFSSTQNRLLMSLSALRRRNRSSTKHCSTTTRTHGQRFSKMAFRDSPVDLDMAIGIPLAGKRSTRSSRAYGIRKSSNVPG